MTGLSLDGRTDAIVFDCGDTLLELDPPREAILADAARELGLEVSLARAERAYEVVDFAFRERDRENGFPDRAAFHREWNAALATALGMRAHLDRLHPLLVERFAERRRWRPFPEVAGALARLTERTPLHVLANWGRGLEELLAEQGLRRFFGTVCASAQVGAAKPSAACFRALLDRTGLDPARTLYVGNDYAADVVGARRAGLVPVLVDRRDRWPGADCARIRSLDELLPPG